MFKIRDFQTSVFLIFTYGQIGKPRFQKSEIYKHPSFRYSPIVKYENLTHKKSEIFKHPSFRYSPIDFQTSVFSIFACSQIRKLGSQKPEISKRPAQHQAFLIFVNIQIQNLDLSESNHLRSVLESQCSSICSFYFYPKAKYENLYLALHENIKSWKCRRRKIWQADSAGRVRLKLIVRDFSDLQPREVIIILAILLGNCVHTCRKNRR